MNFVMGVIAPLMMTGILVLPRSDPPDAHEATAILAGTLLFSFWGASIWSGVGILRAERSLGTFARSLTGIVDARIVLLGKIVGGSLFDLTLIVFVLTLASRLYRLSPAIESRAGLALGLLLVLFSGTGSSLLLGSIMVISRHGFQISQVINTPILLLSGTVLPLSVLPNWLSWVSSVISLSWLQKFIHSTAAQELDWGAFIIAFFLSCSYLVVGLAAFRRVLIKATQEGTLELI